MILTGWSPALIAWLDTRRPDPLRVTGQSSPRKRWNPRSIIDAEADGAREGLDTRARALFATAMHSCIPQQCVTANRAEVSYFNRGLRHSPEEDWPPKVGAYMPLGRGVRLSPVSTRNTDNEGRPPRPRFVNVVLSRLAFELASKRHHP